jgi:phytoene synthase
MPETPDSRPARLLASLYSPPDERAVIDALFLIESEVGASLHRGVDHSVAHVRLQWWRDECERTVKGQAVHPLTQTLAREFAGRAGSSAPPTPDAPPSGTGAAALAGLAGFLDTAVWDLATATFETRRELTAYCERWASAFVLTAALHATGASADDDGSAPSRATWLTIGATIHEIELLAHLSSEAHAGRVRVPLDELAAAGVDPEVLARNPWPEGLVTLLTARHENLRAQLAASVAEIRGAAQPVVRGLLAWSALAWRQSKRAQGALPNQLQPGRFDTLADAWIAWRAARRATKGRFAPL